MLQRLAITLTLAFTTSGCLVNITHVSNPDRYFDEAMRNAKAVAGQQGPARELRVLVYDADEQKLVRIELPLGLVRRLARDSEFDWDKEFFHIKRGRCTPQPAGGTLPPIMNAGSSDEDREFAARNCDFLFTVMVDIASGAQTVARMQAIARERYQRQLGVFTTSYVVCRPTTAQAQAYHQHYAVEQADHAAVERLMFLQGMHAQSFPRDMIESLRVQFAGGHGVYPLIGDPDTVADSIAQIAQAGFAGATVAFVNYVEELPYFVAEVLPRLEAKGLRQRVRV